LFADDTTAIKSGASLPILVREINTELSKMSTWFHANKMALNTSKTKYIIFHNKGKKVDLQDLSIVIDENTDPSINDPSKIHRIDRIHNTNPSQSDRSFKLLGVHLDENLNLNNHVSKLCNKLSRALFILRQVKNLLPQSALRTLYFSLFHCHLVYCPIILSITSQANITKIFKLQKKAIRIISNADYNAHSNPLFFQNGVLPIDQILTYSKLMFMHTVAFNYSLESFSGVWPRNNQRNLDMNLRNATDFVLPPVQRESFRKCPLYSLPHAWNQSGDIKFQHNRTTFKLALLDELFGPLSPLPT
jgi:hypothetical protein